MGHKLAKQKEPKGIKKPAKFHTVKRKSGLHQLRFTWKEGFYPINTFIKQIGTLSLCIYYAITSLDFQLPDTAR